MQRYRRKPEIVEVIQLTEDNLQEAIDWVGRTGSWGVHASCINIYQGGKAFPGDCIMKCPNGRFYVHHGELGWEYEKLPKEK